MGTTKDRNYMDIIEAEDINKRWQEYTELHKKDFHDPDNHNDVITHLEPDIVCIVHGIAKSQRRLRDFHFLNIDVLNMPNNYSLNLHYYDRVEI